MATEPTAVGDESYADMLPDFLDEAHEHLRQLNEHLLALDEQVKATGTNRFDGAVLNEMFRAAHTLKGLSGMLGLRRVNALTHKVENLFDAARNNQLELTHDVIEVVFESIDRLTEMLARLKEGQDDTIDCNAVLEEIAMVLAGSTETPSPSAELAVAQSPAADVFVDVDDDADLASKYISIFVDEAELTLDELTEALLAGADENVTERVLVLCHRIKGSAASVGLRRAATLAHSMEDRLQVLNDRGAELSADMTDAMLDCTEALRAFVGGLKQGQIQTEHFVDAHRKLVRAQAQFSLPPATARQAVQATPAEQPPPPPAVHAPADEFIAVAKPAETIRVDIDRLDQLMNLAGELVVNKARFVQITSGLGQLVAAKRDDRTLANLHVPLNKLLEAVDQLDRVSHGIQQCVMDTRMVPIGPLLARFKRVIRDISRSKGKQIRLVIRGEKTELDKRMIDELGDPLIHVVRNSADHGIELPDDRLAAGKPREGTVTLDACHRGNSILLRIIDDGRGLDATKIRDTAIRKLMLSPTAAGQLTDQQAYQLIWQPGFSTVDQVTEVSGRGMGMDIVRSKVEAIHGTIELSSEPGRGTTIAIKLPLTLAILPSLLAEIDGEVFALPIESVTEIIRVARQDVRQVCGTETAIVRGRVISVVRLSDLFQWHPHTAKTNVANPRDAQTVVIIGNNGHEIGLVVDRLLGEEDVVVKSLAENYRNVDGIAGASVLGDGRVSLILDVGALVERAANE